MRASGSSMGHRPASWRLIPRPMPWLLLAARSFTVGVSVPTFRGTSGGLGEARPLESLAAAVELDVAFDTERPFVPDSTLEPAFGTAPGGGLMVAKEDIAL